MRRPFLFVVCFVASSRLKSDCDSLYDFDLEQGRAAAVLHISARQERGPVQRFYFHLNFSDNLVLDPDGSELDGVDAARHEAAQMIRDMLAECLRNPRDFTLRSIRICNALGKMMTEVSVREAIRDVMKPEAFLVPPADNDP